MPHRETTIKVNQHIKRCGIILFSPRMDTLDFQLYTNLLSFEKSGDST